jgi:tetratricopeptide (TPR) repeat protein
VTDTPESSLKEIRNQAIAEGLQLFILVHPDACPNCAMHQGKIYWADEAPILPLTGCLLDECRCEYRLFDHSGPSLEKMLANGIAAVKAGRMEEAQEWLVQLLQIDRYNEQAWLWLSGAADNDRDRLDCLQEVLKINPDNQFALRGLAALQARGTGPPATSSETGAE